jgi:hypothetical protein
VVIVSFCSARKPGTLCSWMARNARSPRSRSVRFMGSARNCFSADAANPSITEKNASLD